MSTSPISKINRDCFSTIFDVLTRQLPRSETDHRPIVDVRAASQVCRQWRALLLGSPWIWGRVVDLGYGFVPAKRKEWMEEVVRRARSSGLWINGNVQWYAEQSLALDTQGFFIRLLDGELATWERIEKLSVVIYGANIPEVIQRCFLSCAPALTMFEVWLPGFRDKYLFRNSNDSVPGVILPTLARGRGGGGGEEERKRLFANHAPSLQIIYTHQLIPVLNYLSSPWLPQIREVAVPPRATIEDIYTLLQQTPMLQSLILHPIMLTGEWDETLGPLTRGHKANLPHLNDIRIDMNFGGCTRILEYLSISRTVPSVFRLSIHHSSAGIHFLNELERFTENIQRYISHYFQFKGVVNESSSSSRSSIIPAAISLKLEPKTFEFIDITGSTDHNQLFVLHSADFFIRTYNNDWRQDEENSFKNSLLESIVHAAQAAPEHHWHPPTFKSITKLVLDFTHIPPALHHNIYSTLSVFNHVQSLKTDEHSLDIIWEIASQYHLAQGNLDVSTQPEGQVLFPELHVLYLTFIMDGNYTGLIRLLKRRKELGFPSMAKLDVRETYPGGQGFNIVKHDFSVFEEVDGLEVIWKRLKDNHSKFWREDSEPESEICSYVCGSGDPERLRRLPLHPQLPYWRLLTTKTC